MAATYVYIDGLNLYYRALKDTSYKWLNLERFCDLLLPNSQVATIRYFTAKVSHLPKDPDASQRQAVYWRALDTLPRVDRQLGLFKVRSKWRYLDGSVGLLRPGPEVARVRLPEEKGSDVNLASWVLLDGLRGTYDEAVVISNDSDLRTPVRMVQEDLGLPIGIVNPDRSRPDQLHGSFHQPLRTWHLASSQFPAEVTDGLGTFHKPPSWA